MSRLMLPNDGRYEALSSETRGVVLIGWGAKPGRGGVIGGRNDSPLVYPNIPIAYLVKLGSHTHSIISLSISLSKAEGLIYLFIDQKNQINLRCRFKHWWFIYMIR